MNKEASIWNKAIYHHAALYDDRCVMKLLIPALQMLRHALTKHQWRNTMAGEQWYYQQ